MILELILLKYLLVHNNYIIYYKYIEKEKIKSTYKELYNIYITLEDYYKTHPNDITLDELEAYFYSQRPALRDKEKYVYVALFQQMKDYEINNDLIQEIIQQVKQRQEAFELSTLAYDVSQGKGKFIDLITKAHMLEHEEELDKHDDSVFTSDDLEELHTKHIAEPGLRWRLNTLNQMLGSLRKGDFGFLFARPESGKTTFLASEVSFFASQTEGTILWFNNEEQGDKVMLRIYQATLGLTMQQLFSDLPAHKQKYYELTKGNIKLYDSGHVTKTDVERIVYQHKPSLILFDQIDKVKGFYGDRDDLRLGNIYQWARELAKDYCPVIGVCQSDGTGEGKKWLTMDNVALAKTSKQAEADWIIGIGKTHEEGLEFVRHLHASKNKLTGDTDTIAAMRHGRADVLIKPEIARYEDI